MQTHPLRTQTQREFDSKTGLYSYGARYDDQQTGRPIREDFLALSVERL